VPPTAAIVNLQINKENCVAACYESSSAERLEKQASDCRLNCIIVNDNHGKFNRSRAFSERDFPSERNHQSISN